jgi:NitT/TauT family transport system substrate-binding protein
MRSPAPRRLAILMLLTAVLACAAPASPPQPPNPGGSPPAASSSSPGASESAANTPAAQAGSPPELGGAARRELGGGGAVPAPPVALRFPYTAVSVVILPLWVAQDGGYFAQEGLQTDLEFISTGPVLTQAMVAGEVPIAFSGLEAAVTAAIAGADTVVLAAGTERFLFRLYGVPSVTSLADLRGKRIGVTRIGTATDILARTLLQRSGLEPDRDAAIVQVGGLPEILAAMQVGGVDAGVLSPPTMFGAESAGYNRLADTTEIDLPFHQAVVVSTRRYVAAQPDVTRRALRAYLRGVARLKQDKAFAKQVLAKWTNTDDDAVLEQSWVLLDRILPPAPYPRDAAIQPVLDQARAQDPAAAPRAPADFYDDRPLRELEQSGFVASLYR